MKKTTIPDLFWMFIIIEIILHFAFPIKQYIYSFYRYVGILLILIGLYLNWIWVPSTFKKYKTTTDPNEIPSRLVVKGPFRITRNPTYSGMALTFIGVSIFLGTISSLVIPILFVILINKTVIPIEERNLEKRFGKKYIEYKKRVRRWI